jgi:hypothetical protein
MLTQARLHELLSYDPETGIFKRRIRCGRILAGQIAGGIRQDGYLHISVDNKRYLSHRLAWLYVHGVFPEHDTDHIDGNRQNNAIINLRAVTRTTNLQNLRHPKSSNKSTGLLGVTKLANGRYMAQITANRVHKYIGTFATPQAASDAYLVEKRRVHAGCTI